jgi:hypothetical protein
LRCPARINARNAASGSRLGTASTRSRAGRSFTDWYRRPKRSGFDWWRNRIELPRGNIYLGRNRKADPKTQAELLELMAKLFKQCKPLPHVEP